MQGLYQLALLPANITIHVTKRTLSLIYLFFIRLPFSIVGEIVNALSEAFASKSPLSTQASPSHSTVSHRDRLIDPPIPANREIDIDDTDKSKSSLFSSATRVDTPHPARVSNSSRSMRVSSSSHRTLIHDPAQESTNSVYHTPVAEAEVDPLEPESSPIIHPADRSISPTNLIRPGNPVEGNLTTPSNNSISNITSGMTSTSTPGVDLVLGPQSLPFVFRRHTDKQADHISPLTASVPAFTPRYHTTISPAVVIRPAQAIMTSNSKPADVIKSTVVVTADHLSQWRRDQLRHLKAPSIKSGTTARPIPTLYGPLSLPYARNPSGVDATIADETAYLSHIFGLRPAPDVPLPGVAHTVRSVSSGTQTSRSTSGSHTTRSTSGSSASLQLSTNNTSHNSSILTEGSSYTSLGGTHHFRPMVMRDPNQNLGIRKNPSTGKGKEFDAKSGVRTQNVRVSSDNKENDPPLVEVEVPSGKDVIAVSKSSADSQSNTLVPRPRARSIVGAPALTPIPGSPIEVSKEDNPFRVIGETAIDASDSGATMARHRSVSVSASERTSRQPPDDYTSAFTGPVRIPAGYMPVVYDPETMTYEVILPHDASSQPGEATIGAFVTSPRAPPGTPQTTKASHVTPSQSSKADASANWRNKIQAPVEKSNKDRTAVVSTSVRAEAPSTMAFSDRSGDDLVAISGSSNKVMTIETLFERFNHTSPKAADADVSVTVNPPAQASPVPQAVLKPSKSTPVSPRKTSITVLGETSKQATADGVGGAEQDQRKTAPNSPKSAPSAARRLGHGGPAAKGTPGVGKLLKKSPVAMTDENAPVPAVTGMAVTKGKSKGGKK